VVSLSQLVYNPERRAKFSVGEVATFGTTSKMLTTFVSKARNILSESSGYNTGFPGKNRTQTYKGHYHRL
jgi:hypothetical protein